MKFFKPTEPLPTLGRLEKLAIENEAVLLEGWVVSFESKRLDGIEVTIGDRQFTNFELASGLPSPDVKKNYPNIPGTDKGRYRIRIPLTPQEQQQLKNSLVVVTPLFQGKAGGVMPNVLAPSLPIPPQEYIKFVGGHFTDVAFDFLGYFIQRVGLEPPDKVLDVGCGVGRLAYSLAYYLNSQGGYEGFDIAQKLIQWAQSEITSRYTNFNFKVVNIYNQMYNPKGNVKTLDFVFPHPNKSFELVFLISVLTHLRAKEVRHYLDEIARVLKPGGRCLCTCFLLNAESEGAIAKGRGAHKMVHQLEECFTSNPQMPESAIGYKEPLLLGWMRERGLNVVGKYYGQWCARNQFTSYQDFLILQKN